MNDARLHIRDEGTGRPVVLLHGWSCPGQFFQAQVEALKGEVRCIVPDLPGHGLTGAALPATIEAAADALEVVLADRDLRDVVLCGWSMGALVAYALISRHGAGRIARVMSIDMSPRVLNGPGWTHGTLNGLDADLNAQVLENMVADWPKLPGGIARHLFAAGSEPDPALLDFAREQIAAGDPELLREMWASLTAQDFRVLLSDFPVPFHLVAGLKSRLYGTGVNRWHEEHVPDCSLHPFAGSGHAPHLEEPEAFNRLLLELLKR